MTGEPMAAATTSPDITLTKTSSSSYPIAAESPFLCCFDDFSPLKSGEFAPVYRELSFTEDTSTLAPADPQQKGRSSNGEQLDPHNIINVDAFLVNPLKPWNSSDLLGMCQKQAVELSTYYNDESNNSSKQPHEEPSFRFPHYISSDLTGSDYGNVPDSFPKHGDDLSQGLQTDTIQEAPIIEDVIKPSLMTDSAETLTQAHQPLDYLSSTVNDTKLDTGIMEIDELPCSKKPSTFFTDANKVIILFDSGIKNDRHSAQQIAGKNFGVISSDDLSADIVPSQEKLMNTLGEAGTSNTVEISMALSDDMNAYYHENGDMHHYGMFGHLQPDGYHTCQTSSKSATHYGNYSVSVSNVESTSTSCWNLEPANVTLPEISRHLYTMPDTTADKNIESVFKSGSTTDLNPSAHCLGSSYFDPCDVSKPPKYVSRTEDQNWTNTVNKRKKANENEGCKRCNCRKTKCLKLYCDCFAAGEYCAEACACQGCLNRPEYDITVLETRKEIESRNPLAFSPKVVHVDLPRDKENDAKQKSSLSRHKRGCNCKKSKCLKNYCECYQAGVGCSFGCRCENCENIYGKKNGNAEIIETTYVKAKVERSEKSIFDGRADVKKEISIQEQSFQCLDPIPPLLDASRDSSNSNSSSRAQERSLAITPYDNGMEVFTVDNDPVIWDGHTDVSNFSMTSQALPDVFGSSISDSLGYVTVLPDQLLQGNTRLSTDFQRWCNGGSLVSPMPILGATTYLFKSDPDSGLHSLSEDNTRENLKDITNFPYIICSSLNSKRVSPTKCLQNSSQNQ